MKQLFLIIGLLAGCTTLVQAHAFLDHAEPKVGDLVKESPATVKLWFDQQIAGPGCNVSVFNAKGKEVDDGHVTIDHADATEMSVPVTKLVAGTYKVVWTAFCIHGHKTTGSFTFKVAGK